MDPASPTLKKGFITVCAAFHERGFCAPPHRFLHSLLRSYGLELDLLTPLGILHMAVYVTLRKADTMIEPPLNLWSHFFWVQLRQDLGVGAAFVGSVYVSV
jgi:hypothetical protein